MKKSSTDNPVMKPLKLEHLISTATPRIPCPCSWIKSVTKNEMVKDNSKKKIQRNNDFVISPNQGKYP